MSFILKKYLVEISTRMLIVDTGNNAKFNKTRYIVIHVFQVYCFYKN
jgi:hypothetical protein